MVSKKTIRKVQLVIGIIILLIGILGLVYSCTFLKSYFEREVRSVEQQLGGVEYENSSLEIKATVSTYFLERVYELKYDYLNQKYIIISTSIILIILSLLFITQGLANKLGVKQNA